MTDCYYGYALNGSAAVIGSQGQQQYFQQQRMARQ